MAGHAFEPTSGERSSLLAEVLGKQRSAIEDLDAFTRGVFEKHPSAIRMKFGTDQLTINAPLQSIDWYPQGKRCIDPNIRLSRTIDYAAGDFFLQDAGSLLALAACDADQESKSPKLVCDLCAAPGGKASALLESIGDGFLLANESIQSRIPPLAFNLARTGVGRYAISSMDPDDLADKLGGIFDLVLVDAPCSGQALLGRGKQSLAAITSAQVEHSAARAKRILAAALKLLRPGGQLVFSTCTFAELGKRKTDRMAG